MGERNGESAVTGAPPDGPPEQATDDESQVTTVDAHADAETTHARRVGFVSLGLLSSANAVIRRHKTFTVVLAGGTLLRMLAMLGYRPASWFNDSFDYLHVAMSPYPHPIRPDGYSFLLWILRPFHSFALVAGLQHL
ncbi:MAG TPA: hypothetical protein VE198_24905, partial [Actinoallomurus sp.]|nr:hypothetical protein [Actinoallomurus sp.]